MSTTVSTFLRLQCWVIVAVLVACFAVFVNAAGASGRAVNDDGDAAAVPIDDSTDDGVVLANMSLHNNASTNATDAGEDAMASRPAGVVLNVLGTPLAECSRAPKTGFYRTGRCDTSSSDHGLHVVCAEMTSAFLADTRRRGNDLSTPSPRNNFPGLQPGDFWCLCLSRWLEIPARERPRIRLEATHALALTSRYRRVGDEGDKGGGGVTLADLQPFAV